jgi:copper oxidase (laccase) domain-containing protein
MNDELLVIALSTAPDGSMSKAVDAVQRYSNRQHFLNRHNISTDQTVLVQLKYEGDDYRRYHTVTSESGGDGIIRPSKLVADALFTTEPNVALLLPVADCIGAVMYDSVNHVIGLSHLGRHNLAQGGATTTVEYMEIAFNSNPNDIAVWLSPAAGEQNYPLYDFDNRSLHEVAVEQLLSAGVSSTNIEIDSTDTTSNDKLFSHSEFLKGNRLVDGRQAVVVMMRR